jgi:transcriptional regulator GlxA family with amidase domain
MLAQIALFDGFDPLDALAPFEVLAAGSAAAGGRLDVEFASAEGVRDVPSGRGVALRATAALDPQRATLMVVPGAAGRVNGDGPDTVAAILERTMATRLPDVLRAAAANSDLTLASVCGGSLLLGMAGLLNGRPAVTHRLGMNQLAAVGAVPVPARVVDDGDLVTAGGVTSGLDLGMYLVERELGPKVAHALELLFEYERRGTVWRPNGPDPIAL